MNQGPLQAYKRGTRKLRSEGIVSLAQSTPWFILRKTLGRQKVFDDRTKLRHQIQKWKYTAPATPYKPISVDPQDINKKIYGIPIMSGLGQIIRGNNWPQNNYRNVRSLGTYMGLKQRFVEGRSWEDTVYYKNYKKKFNSGNQACVDGYSNLKEFKEVRCEFVDKLFKNIRDKGYRPNYDAKHTVPDKDHRSQENRWKHSLEPLVAIDKGGEIYLCDGNHRHAIADLLNIKSIPVNVLARHKEWQQIRDEIHKKTQYSSESKLDSDLQVYLDHPDIQDVLA